MIGKLILIETPQVDVYISEDGVLEIDGVGLNDYGSVERYNHTLKLSEDAINELLRILKQEGGKHER